MTRPDSWGHWLLRQTPPVGSCPLNKHSPSVTHRKLRQRAKKRRRGYPSLLTPTANPTTEGNHNFVRRKGEGRKHCLRGLIKLIVKIIQFMGHPFSRQDWTNCSAYSSHHSIVTTPTCSLCSYLTICDLGPKTDYYNQQDWAHKTLGRWAGTEQPRDGLEAVTCSSASVTTLWPLHWEVPGLYQCDKSTKDLWGKFFFFLLSSIDTGIKVLLIQ